MDDRDIGFFLSVRRIKEIGFFINESLIGMPSNQPVKLEIGMNLSFNADTDLVFLNIRVYYHYPDRPAGEILADIQVQNVFELINLRNFLHNNDLTLPPAIIISIIAMSISHTRALFAKNIAGTLFQENLIAVINPQELAKHFFPQMFQTASQL